MMQYRLAKGVAFEENPDKNGGTLSIRYPQRIIRLSSNGVESLKLLWGQASRAKSLDEKMQSFADNLENQGVLHRHFPGLTQEQLLVVSIVIPTFNRSKMLDSCLQSLLNLDYPNEKMEIIVVDDASPEPVNLGIDQPFIKLIRMSQNRGPGAARNEGVRHARGEIIAFLDDDCLADKDWLKALVPCFQYPDVAAAGGRVESANLDRPLEQYEQVQSPLLMGASQRKVRKGSSVSYLATCNLLVRKESLLSAGGFDPLMRVGEDVDLCWRILERGECIYYIPEGLIFHHHRSQLVPFLRRRYNYGQSEAKLQSRNQGERRRLVFFPGNSFIMGTVILLSLIKGISFAVVTGIALAILNLVWQTISKARSIKASQSKPGLWTVFLAMIRSQSTAVYLYSQHFARYYSIPATVLVLLVFPQLAPLFLAIHLLPGIVDFKIKKTSVAPLNFFTFHFLENLFYQAGVFSGCLREYNWRPLAMQFIRADANLLNRLAAKN